MAAHNDITGDKIATKNISEDFRTGWDRIFSKKSNKEIESEVPKGSHENNSQADPLYEVEI